MGIIFWVVVGITIGYFFKPQLDPIVGKIIKAVKDNRNKDNYLDD